MNAARKRDPDKLRALFTTAVWGAEYVERFLNYSLRTQISAGNLGAFDRRSVYLIITDSDNVERIKSSPINTALSNLVSVEFVDIDDIKSDATNKYALLTACQNYALERAIDFDAIFFGYGDALWADGSYQAAAARLMQGHDAVFSFGYPVLDRPFKHAIDNLTDADRAAAVSIAPRTFAQMIYRNLHPMARANLWHSQWMTHCPSYVVWDNPSQGLLLRAFHMHPVAFRTLKDSPYFFAPFRSTLDEEFVARLTRTNARLYVSQNSDEICVCSLAEETELAYRMEPPRPVNLADLANFAETYAGLTHRHLFGRSLRLVIDDVIESQWQQSESEAATLAQDVQRCLSTPDSVMALENSAGFRARLQRQLNNRHWSETNDVSIGVERILAANDSWLNPRAEVQLSSGEGHAKVAALRRAVADDLIAKDFTTTFQASAGGGTSRVRMTMRGQLIKITHNGLRQLHATGVTRVVRTRVLPHLPAPLRDGIVGVVYRINAANAYAPRTRPMARLRFVLWLRRLLGLRI